MSTNVSVSQEGVLGDIKANSGVAIGVGIFLIVAGMLAIASPTVAGMSIALLVGLALVAGGLGQCYVAVRVGLFGKGLFAFLVGALTVLLGGYLMMQPAAGLAALTLVLAGFFIVSGVLEGIAAFSLRPAQGWGWMLFSAAVSFALGVMIWNQFPLSGAWAIGTLFGVRLLMSGWMFLFLGLAGKKAS